MKKPIKGKVISGVKINKKAKQKGGLAAFDHSRRFPTNKTPKIYIGLSKQYLRLQNQYVESTIEEVVELAKTDEFIKNISAHVKQKMCVTSLSETEDRISFSAWVQGPPSFSLFNEDYNLDTEEKTALSLLTMTVKSNDGKPEYAIYHNGVVISIHAIARLIQRMGYESEHISIKKEIDQIIPWATIKSSLMDNGIKYMKQLVSPSNHGMWFGSMALIPDRKREMKPSAVYFVRTFVSESILEENQVERLNTMRDLGITDDEDLKNSINEYLVTKKTPDDEVAISGLIQVMEAKDDFYSEDKFMERVLHTIEESDYQKTSQIDDSDFSPIEKFEMFEYRPVERANI